MVFDKTREFAYISKYFAEDIYKVLSVDLSEDSFELVKVDRDEMVEE
ncbi:MAG: hypothetical protein KBT48_11280 [Firmicutes bacterium]|nr:hypothetical protein [Bacillota bacterium]